MREMIDNVLSSRVWYLTTFCLLGGLRVASFSWRPYRPAKLGGALCGSSNTQFNCRRRRNILFHASKPSDDEAVSVPSRLETIQNYLLADNVLDLDLEDEEMKLLLEEEEVDGGAFVDEDLEPLETVSNIPLQDLLASSSSNVSYFYLQNELGLSEEALWRVTFEANSALGMRADTIRHKVDTLRSALNLHKEQVADLLEKQPAILHLSAENNVLPKLRWLTRKLGLQRDELRLLILHTPSLLGYSRENLDRKIQFFRRILRLSKNDTRKLLLKDPRLLRSSVRTGLLPHFRFLVKDMELELHDIQKLVLKYPKILLLSVSDNLVPKLVFFALMTLDMDVTETQRLLLNYPAWLDYNLERHILPLTRYLTVDLDLEVDHVRGILLKHPRLMSYSLDKIKHMVGYLRYGYGFSPEIVRRILIRSPSVLGLTEDSVKRRLDRLSTLLGGDAALQTVIAGLPTLIVLDVKKNILPKWNYLLGHLSSEKLLREGACGFPAVLGYSLEKRLRPRMEALIEDGHDASKIFVTAQLTEPKFQTWLSRQKKPQETSDGGAKTNVDTDGPAARIHHWTRPRKGLDRQL